MLRQIGTSTLRYNGNAYVLLLQPICKLLVSFHVGIPVLNANIAIRVVCFANVYETIVHTSINISCVIDIVSLSTCEFSDEFTRGEKRRYLFVRAVSVT